jgi:hypothetical protein
MSLGDSIDEFIQRLRGYGPYGISLAIGALGFGIYKLGGTEDAPAIAMRWSGAALSILCPVVLCLWHFFRWPPWFGVATS